jgi:transcriptional regulator with XRE-family HTH domain
VVGLALGWEAGLREASFGRRLREMRRQVGLTQTELAGDDLSTSYISLLESGKRKPTPDVVVRLASRLSTSIELLSHGETQPAGDASDDEQLDLCEAHLSLLSGDVETADAHYRRIWKSSGVSAGALREALLGLAWCAERRGDLDEACSRYTQWLGSHDEAYDDFEIRINTVSRLCRCRRETGRLREAADLAERTLTELRGAGLDGTPSAVLLRLELQEMYREQDRPAAADRIAQDLPDLLDRLDDVPAHRDAYRHAGNAARDEGRIPLALGLARRALNTHRFGLQSALTAWLTTLHPRSGETVEPARLSSVRARLDRLAGPADAARCDIELAERHLEGGDPDAAARAARSALDLLGAGFAVSRAQATLLLARARWAQQLSTEAAAHYADAAGQFENVRMFRLAVRTYLELAGRLEQVHRVREALEMYRKAAEVMGVGEPEPLD